MDAPVRSGWTAGAAETVGAGVPRDEDDEEILSLWGGGLRRKSLSTSFSPRLGNVHSVAACRPADRHESHGACPSGPWRHLVRSRRHLRQATVPRRRVVGGVVLPSKAVGVEGDWRGGDGSVFATRMLPPSSGDELRSDFMTVTVINNIQDTRRQVMTEEGYRWSEANKSIVEEFKTEEDGL